MFIRRCSSLYKHAPLSSYIFLGLEFFLDILISFIFEHRITHLVDLVKQVFNLIWDLDILLVEVKLDALLSIVACILAVFLLFVLLEFILPLFSGLPEYLKHTEVLLVGRYKAKLKHVKDYL